MTDSDRKCSGLNKEGKPCRAHPLRNSDLCRMHSPDLAKEVTASRKRGGQQSKRREEEADLAAFHDVHGIDTFADIRRFVEIGLLETLTLPTSPAKMRSIVSGAQLAVFLLQAEGGVTQLGDISQFIARPGRSNDNTIRDGASTSTNDVATQLPVDSRDGE